MTIDKQVHFPSASTSSPLYPHPIAGETHMRPDRINIGDGLLLRWSTKEDEANVADLMANVFMWFNCGPPVAEDELPKPSEFVRALVHRAFREDCPVTTVYDFALVENTRAPKGQNPIVAGISLQKNLGYFGKVKLTFGVLEIVATHPDYRNKGLMRRLFQDLIHPASDLRGDVVQIILGIPYFYRLFGYEFAIGFRIPRKLDDLASIPPLPEHETVEKGGPGEPFRLRIPAVEDVPYLVEMSTPEKMLNQAEVGLLYNEEYWRFWVRDAIANMSSQFDVSRDHRVVVDAKTGKDCGVVMTYGNPMLTVGLFVLDDGYTYRQAMYPVLRQMLDIANGPSAWELKEQAEKDKVNALPNVDGSSSDSTAITASSLPSTKKIQSMSISLDPEHPIMKLLEPKTKIVDIKYKFYTRIPSYAKFLLKIATVLEDRLAKSCLKAITVTWQFDFFHRIVGSMGKGLEVVFESGKLVSASDDWVPPTPHEKMMAARERIAKAKAENRLDIKPLVYQAQFAPLTFTRLLVGDLSMDQMMDVYAECRITSGDDDAKVMLDILFPKQLFHVDLHSW